MLRERECERKKKKNPYHFGRTIHLLCLREGRVLFQVKPSLCPRVPTILKIFHFVSLFYSARATRRYEHTHARTCGCVAARSLQVLINHPAVIPSWQLKLTSSWMGENKRPSSGPFPDTFIQSRPDCLRQHQQLFRLHLSPFDKACQVIFL